VLAAQEFLFDLNSLKYNWKSKTFFSLPKRFSKGTQTLNVEASGNNTDINIKKISATGGIVQGTFEGSFYIPKLQPSGYLNLEHYAFFNGNKISAEIFFEPRKNKGFDFFIPEIIAASRLLKDIHRLECLLSLQLKLAIILILSMVSLAE